MGLRDIAERVENSINRRGIVKRRRQGWHPRVVPFVGYGSTKNLHVLARVIMADPNDTLEQLPDDVPFTRDLRVAALEAQRGFRQFFTTQVGFIQVKVQVGDITVSTYTNRNGYLDVQVENHGLAPGWQQVKITPIVGTGATAEVLIVDDSVKTGIISDIDDTIMATNLPRPILAAWNSWVRRSATRKAVPGMAELYRQVLKMHPGTPVFYLSTGAWNTLPTLQIFNRRHGFPSGPMLLTDWGPTPTGIFRYGTEHKRMVLRNLFITFPNIRWLLVGDNGQHDPVLYGEAAIEHPNHVEAIAIRELTPTEQVLSHGTFEALDPTTERQVPCTYWVPTLRGPDGFNLSEKLIGRMWRY